MRKSVWVNLVVACAFAGLGYFAGLKNQKISEAAQCEIYQKDGHIYCGVALPDAMVSGSFYQDLEKAKEFLSPNYQWKYMVSGPVPMIPDYTGFGFRALACDELLVSN
jgi:hypothetical protein